MQDPTKLFYRIQLVNEDDDVVEEETQRLYGAAQEALGRVAKHKEQKTLVWVDEMCDCGDTREYHTNGDGACNSELRQIGCSCGGFHQYGGIFEDTQRIEELAAIGGK